MFTADDGTVWRYDAATGNYVQQPEEQQKQEDEVIDRLPPPPTQSFTHWTANLSPIAHPRRTCVEWPPAPGKHVVARVALI